MQVQKVPPVPMSQNDRVKGGLIYPNRRKKRMLIVGKT